MCSGLAYGETSWEENLYCMAELVRVESMVSNRPTEITRDREIPLAQEGTSKQPPVGKSVFYFDGGVQLHVEVTFHKNGSIWSRYGDRLRTSAKFLQISKGSSEGEASTVEFYDFDERTSDEVSNHYRLRLAKEQFPRLFVINFLVNNKIAEWLFLHDKTEADLSHLVQEGLIDSRTPYAANLFCSLWRPGARPRTVSPLPTFQ